MQPTNTASGSTQSASSIIARASDAQAHSRASFTTGKSGDGAGLFISISPVSPQRLCTGPAPAAKRLCRQKARASRMHGCGHFSCPDTLQGYDCCHSRSRGKLAGHFSVIYDRAGAAGHLQKHLKLLRAAVTPGCRNARKYSPVLFFILPQFRPAHAISRCSASSGRSAFERKTGVMLSASAAAPGRSSRAPPPSDTAGC